uniref:Ig-like domain-containing protein n=1 Tax=Poecilia reticulata TaxID=8081 RepID=A0A3P9PH01_POERE
MNLFPVCSDELKFEVKTVTVGQNVTLSCPRQTSALYRETFYWIRLVSGNWPEFLGATVNLKIDDVSKIPHIQTKQEEGEFHLHINEAKRNDTGLYYCIKVKQLEFIFMKGTFLKIRGQESDIIDVILDRPSGSVNAENSDTLQCSVLSDSEKKTCPADNRVYWFKAGSDHSHPSLLYLQENSGDECENSPEAQTAQKCFYNFSGTSDSGIHHCAVAACGKILFGNEAKLSGRELFYIMMMDRLLEYNVQIAFFSSFIFSFLGANSMDFSKIFLPLLCSALVISLVVISWLIYKIKKKKCGCCNGNAHFIHQFIKRVFNRIEILIFFTICKQVQQQVVVITKIR